MSNSIKNFNSIQDIANYIIDRQLKTGKYISVKMLLGNGDKKQYKDRNELEKAIEKIANKYIYKPDNKFGENLFIYFGDVPKKDAPDIGYAYEYLSKIRPDIKIIMIQIKEMEKYGVPNFVNVGVYFHDDYDKNDKQHKWGGFEDVNGKYKIYSNTKQWFKLHLLLKKMREEYKNKGYKNMSSHRKIMFGIEQCYLLGEGGPISQQQFNLMKLFNNYIIKYNKEKGDEIDDIELSHMKQLESKY
jgi:hypothetical protein